MAGWNRITPKRLLTVLMLGATVAIGATALPPLQTAESQAQAVIPIGPGYQIPNPDRPSMIGGYLAPDGTVIYCLQWGAQSPTGPNDAVLSISAETAYANWSHLEIARVNYIISKWGQTTSNDQAAAVQMAIWMRHPGSVDPFFPEHRFVTATIRDDATRARIAAHARAMSAEADQFTPYARAAVGTLAIVTDANEPFAGELRISGLPEHTLGTVGLEGAIFETTQTATAAGVRNGDVLRFTGVPSDTEIGSYRISAGGTFVTAGGPADELIVWRTPDGFQDLGQASSVIPDFEFSLASHVDVPIPFQPQLETVAAQSLVQVGQPLRDTVTFSLAEGSLPWRQFSDGSYLGLEAWCQAYGPLDEQPQTHSAPPSDAPAFGEAVSVSIGGDRDDPLDTRIVAEIAEKPTEEGYYTFVCGISEERQSSATVAAALPQGYEFQHEYGLVEETTKVAAPLAQTGLNGTVFLAGGITAAILGFGMALLGAWKRHASKARRNHSSL